MDYFPDEYSRRGAGGGRARFVLGVWLHQEFPHECGSPYRIHQGIRVGGVRELRRCEASHRQSRGSLGAGSADPRELGLCEGIASLFQHTTTNELYSTKTTLMPPQEPQPCSCCFFSQHDQGDHLRRESSQRTGCASPSPHEP